jgi:hypothetical protein
MQAQETKQKEKKHYTKVKTKVPKYTKTVSPGDSYVYIQEDYTWNPNTMSWEWNGNRWVTPPQTGQTWVPGHWMSTGYGWTWVDGYWK